MKISDTNLLRMVFPMLSEGVSLEHSIFNDEMKLIISDADFLPGGCRVFLTCRYSWPSCYPTGVVLEVTSLQELDKWVYCNLWLQRRKGLLEGMV